MEYWRCSWFRAFSHRNSGIYWNAGSKTDLPSFDKLVVSYVSSSFFLSLHLSSSSYSCISSSILFFVHLFSFHLFSSSSCISSSMVFFVHRSSSSSYSCYASSSFLISSSLVPAQNGSRPPRNKKCAKEKKNKKYNKTELHDEQQYSQQNKRARTSSQKHRTTNT